MGIKPSCNFAQKVREKDLAAMTELLASALETFNAITGASSLHEAVGYAAAGVKKLRKWRTTPPAPLLNE